ncbi:MAG: TetR/AcrR family transcriptional regulator [Eubacteriales bacterium]|nr:TetR/AcrR family transcriptional regulator [Eubacteriales bacterium]
MKNTIIEQSIESLKKDGLKFSIDSLAAQLGISKKTVYKYFPDKESLAYAVFEKYYADARKKAVEIAEKSDNKRFELLSLYFSSKTMTRDEVFNKYTLNLSVSAFAKQKENELWDCICPFLTKCDDAVKVIVDGAFEKLLRENEDCDRVIRRLEALW